MPGRASILNKDYMEGKAKGSLVGSQKELDLNNNNKIDKEDFSMLRDKKNKGGEGKEKSYSLYTTIIGDPKTGEPLSEKEYYEKYPKEKKEKSYPSFVEKVNDTIKSALSSRKNRTFKIPGVGYVDQDKIILDSLFEQYGEKKDSGSFEDTVNWVNNTPMYKEYRKLFLQDIQQDKKDGKYDSRDKKTSGGIMNIEDPSAGIPEVGEILKQKSAEDIQKLDTQMRLRQDDADRKSMELFPLKKLEELDRVKQEQEDKKAIEASRRPYQEGGSMLVPTEMEDMPVDTYTPEEQANAEATQLPDPKMEEQYLEFIVEESLQEEEQDYLMEALEKDPRLSEILDKVVMTASEFSGAGEVDGPGTGVSDSIPARLSDGEFVITEKATSMLGADNLQEMMDDAERMADGGVPMREKRQIGGMLGMPTNPEEEELEDMSQMRSTDAEVNEAMLRSNQVPSLRRY